LDVTIQAQVLDTLQAVQAKRRMGMLFISHELGVVARVADSVAVLYHGEIIEQASAAEFFHHPQQAYSKHLFASIPAMKTSQPSSADLPSANTPLLKVENLGVRFPLHGGFLGYGKKAVNVVEEVSFNLYRGKTLALVGESGSGKTTTGRAILQLLSSVSGHIYFEGRLLHHLSRLDLKNLRKDIQVIFQDPYAALNPRMTIASILEEGMLVQGAHKTAKERVCRIDDLLVAVGLSPDCKQRYPHEFSGGERQRICIARALTVEPKILICDEPTSALDVSVQAQILKLLDQLQKERGLAYLLITHNFGVVSYLADEVAVMYRGRIVEQGPSQQILSAPQHPYTQKLLGSVLTI
jgi:peptide/nickel transport system ATP-binding protein